MVGAHLVTRERDVPLYHDRAPCHRPEGDLSAVRLLVAAPSHREPVALPQLVEDEQARVGRYVRVGARAVEERQRRAVERHDRRVNLRPRRTTGGEDDRQPCCPHLAERVELLVDAVVRRALSLDDGSLVQWDGGIGPRRLPVG